MFVLLSFGLALDQTFLAILLFFLVRMGLLKIYNLKKLFYKQSQLRFALCLREYLGTLVDGLKCILHYQMTRSLWKPGQDVMVCIWAMPHRLIYVEFIVPASDVILGRGRNFRRWGFTGKIRSLYWRK
jgi:hypothetical protein